MRVLLKALAIPAMVLGLSLTTAGDAAAQWGYKPPPTYGWGHPAPHWHAPRPVFAPPPVVYVPPPVIFAPRPVWGHGPHWGPPRHHWGHRRHW